MANPFEKRATEYLRDEAAFLSVVTPEPLDAYFEPHAKNDVLFDRLCMIFGNPGSGKTTIARLIQFKTVYTLIHSPNHTEYRPLEKALSDCKIISNRTIGFIACRIPMESEFREFWELPYDNDIKSGLLKSFLQAKAIILWLQSLKNVEGVDLKRSYFIFREGASVVSDSLGGHDAESVLKKAIEVEREIYKISAALLPPQIDQLPEIAKLPYHPFDAIEQIVATSGLIENRYRPLVILDDVHSLHSEQITFLQEWLAKREIKVSRWLMMRLDAQTPENILEAKGSDSTLVGESTIKRSREITEIWLQSSDDRAQRRRYFRQMAKSMANKYLGLMPVFIRQGIKNMQDILGTEAPQISESSYKKLSEKVSALQRKYGISNSVRQAFEADIQEYEKNCNEHYLGKDEKLAMLLILLNRYVVRTPQVGLFESDTTAEPSKPIKPNSGVLDGARILLMHEFNRAYYYGIDTVCDGSSENAEQFLQLAGQLASASEAKIVQGKPSILSAEFQHKLLLEKAKKEVDGWTFPLNKEVKALCEKISSDCVNKSLEPNASLDGGANAYGIPDEQFKKIHTEFTKLAQILKFGVAYGAISIKKNHKAKNRIWTLIELSGPMLMSKKLTFTRGGFLERDISDLLTVSGESK